MGVIMQAFFWDCPRLEGFEYKWWERVRGELDSLSASGFTALWLPPASKAANIGGPSMGYDPYDYYDLGEFDQKGSKETWFGSRQALASLIDEAHAKGMQVYADLVLNHNNGGDEIEQNPVDHVSRWTKFLPLSGKFARNYLCFHPSPYETWDQETFGDMPDLCHRNPYVYEEFIAYARWLLEQIGFDGFRYDFVKGYGAWITRAIQELRALKGGGSEKPFGVGECWDSDRTIDDWLEEVNAWTDNPVSAFDFPLRYRLRDLCQSYGFSLRSLADPGVVFRDRPDRAVTFVENHDVVRGDAIIRDKMLAYAFILTHEGYPCVFWQDYYGWNLAELGQVSGIAALVSIHESHAGGPATILHVDDDLYVMQREGWGNQKGLVFVLNNRGDGWGGRAVRTKWGNTRFAPAAWRSASDIGEPISKESDAGGWCDFWAPPRGYAVYLPD